MRDDATIIREAEATAAKVVRPVLDALARLNASIDDHGARLTRLAGRVAAIEQGSASALSAIHICTECGHVDRTATVH